MEDLSVPTDYRNHDKIRCQKTNHKAITTPTPQRNHDPTQITNYYKQQFFDEAGYDMNTSKPTVLDMGDTTLTQFDNDIKDTEDSAICS